MSVPKEEMKILQRLINSCVSRNNGALLAQKRLNEFCETRYGFIPSDIDADEIIDAVLGGSGQSAGMRATEFDKIMTEKMR